ncbi:carbohydrate binding family 9 domain-containing protein [Acidobacteria bacterium AH-259-D05]|nr:carbohydrate binding family 9 domain-containing protein [Acidobacteria bacterium AH-259-D05]
MRATHSKNPPTLDGILSEEIWGRTSPTEAFTQKEPHVGEKASESTVVRVIYTDRSLFLGIACSDSSAKDIVATERRRDGDLLKDDSIWILIDSFHDHRNAFLFATNPLGTKYDALIIDEGSELNVQWDDVWKVVPHRDEQGWAVEVEIPLKTLRLKSSATELGLEFRRVIRRKNEFVFWNSWDRDFRFEQVSQAGHLTGLEDLELGKRGRLKPYVLGGSGKRGTSGWDNRSEVGIEDLKWRITPSLTLDLTYNTDFAEVELDAQRTNLRDPTSRLFFPEKREFFLEGAGFLDFAARINENPGDTFRAFFSRRIGLTSDGRRVPVLGGLKLTGRIGGFSMGALNMQTQEEDEIGSNNFTVLRLRYDLFPRSTVGTIVTNRSGNGSFNRTVGLDTRLVFFNNFTFEGSLMRSATPGVNEEPNAYHAKGYWRTDLWDIGAGHLTLESNFNSEMGFAQRSPIRKSVFDIAFKPRPNISWIRQIFIRPFVEYFTTPENVLVRKIAHYNLEILLQSGDRLRFAPHPRFERLFRPVQLAPEVFIPPGEYTGTSYVMEYILDPSRRLAGRFRFAPQREFFGGSKKNFVLRPQWKPIPSLILDLQWEIDRIHLPQARFTSHVINTTFNYSPSTTLITSTTFQYNNTAKIRGFNFRLNYIYRPGDDLFFVYRDIRNNLNPEFSDRAILIKFTRSFDF